MSSLIRCHHLRNTLWGGPYGWRDEQWPDGTAAWESPRTGRWTGIDLPRRALKLIYCAVNSFEPFGQAVKSFERHAPRVAPRAENNPLRETAREGSDAKGVMVANQNIEISKKGYAAFDKGDVETVLNDYDDSVEFVIPGTNAVSGTYRGKDGVKELFGKIAEQNFKITPSRFLADDDVVVVLSQVSAGGESGLQADAFTYRDGKIVKVQNYGDTALFERIFGSK